MFSPFTSTPLNLPNTKRFRKRRQQQLMMAALVIEMLHEDELKHLRGRLLGSKNIRRTRKKVESMWAELGCYARRAYRMSLDAFNFLHETLEPALREEFNVFVCSQLEGCTPLISYNNNHVMLLRRIA